MKWDDYAGKEAFDNAKRKFWGDINGLPCDVSLPDPDLHIQQVDWDSTVDPELVLDLEREPAPSDKASDEVVILDSSRLLDQSFYCTGWGDAETPPPSGWGGAEAIVPSGWGDNEIPPPTSRVEADTPQPPVWGYSGVNVNIQVGYSTGWGDPNPNVNSDLHYTIPAPGWGDPNPIVNSGVTGWGEPETDPPIDYHVPPLQGWDADWNAYGGVNYGTGWEEAETNLPKDTDTGEGRWEQFCVPQEHEKVSEWGNQEDEYWQWNERQQSGFQKIGKGRGNENWRSFDGGNKRRDKAAVKQQSGFETSAYHGNENQVGSGRGGRRNNRGKKRGGFAYGRSYGENMATARWEVKTK